jgi:putative DNA methylase
MAVPIDQGFDVELADRLAQVESFNKHLYRPNSYLHKWWARRCGSTFRMILKHLVEDPARRGYYCSGGLEGKVILDPMMGGGTTLHEAIRLGASVIGMDVDPIPVLQARAALSDIRLELLEEGFETLMDHLHQRVGSFFVTHCPVCGKISTLRFTLYAAQRSCVCGPALFVDSLTLRHEPDGSRITLCPACGEIGRNGECTGHARDNVPPILEKGVAECPRCAEPFLERVETPFYARYTPVAVVGRCGVHGLFFKRPDSHDRERMAAANDRRPEFSPREDFGIARGPKSADLLRRGITSYVDLFSSRQTLYLQAAGEALPTFPPLVRLNLALLVSTSLEFNSMLCGYKGGDKRRPGAVRHTFSHHAYSFPYTALENNPLVPGIASGALPYLFATRIRRARQWASAPSERVVAEREQRTVVLAGERDAGQEVILPEDLRSGTRRFLLVQGSSARSPLEPGSVDYVVTDPPYFDSVQYSDLAAFFRVWLRRFVPEHAQWDYDASQSAVESPGAHNTGRYERLLSSIFTECRRVLKECSGRMVFTFHHWDPRAWSALTVALRRAGFILINRYVVHSENPTSVHIANLKALTHDAILVTAPGGCMQRGQWERPAAIDVTDSRRFCQSCATSLGWMLESNLFDEEIPGLWIDLLAPRNRSV